MNSQESDVLRPVQQENVARTYHFIDILSCNMCQAATDTAKVLGMRLNQSQGVNPRNKTGIGVTICKCANCGLNFPQPLPVPERLSDHYGIPAESYWKNKDFTVKEGYFARQIADAKRLLPFRPGMAALDVGAGIGDCMITLERAGFECQGIEPSAPFRDHAIEIMGVEPTKLKLATVEEAEFPAASFDFITFGAVLEHLYDPAGAIEKTLEWLKPSGLIQIEVPSSDHLMPAFLNTYFRLRGTNYVTNLSPMHAPFHLYEFTRKAFARHAARAGYTIAHSYIDVASIRHVPSFTKPLLRYWMSKTGRGQQLTVWLRKI